MISKDTLAALHKSMKDLQEAENVPVTVRDFCTNTLTALEELTSASVKKATEKKEGR